LSDQLVSAAILLPWKCMYCLSTEMFLTTIIYQCFLNIFLV
jgi:hypothetical protein